MKLLATFGRMSNHDALTLLIRIHLGQRPRVRNLAPADRPYLIGIE